MPTGTVNTTDAPIEVKITDPVTGTQETIEVPSGQPIRLAQWLPGHQYQDTVCPNPNTLILMADGSEKKAGELVV